MRYLLTVMLVVLSVSTFSQDTQKIEKNKERVVNHTDKLGGRVTIVYRGQEKVYIEYTRDGITSFVSYKDNKKNTYGYKYSYVARNDR